MKLKVHLSKLEIAFGLVCLLFSVWSLVSYYRCPAWAADCGGWEQLVAWVGLCFGASFVTSGLLLRQNGAVSWLGHLLIFYAMALVAIYN